MDERYFEWIVRLVCGDGIGRRKGYRKLLRYLHGRPFLYSLVMDENRARDGVALRYRFAACERSRNTPCEDEPCSVLEMMAALSIRCEEQVMSNPDIGNQTDKWFFAMIENLGLGEMTDFRFDEDYVCEVIDRLLERRYERDGRGGLFTVSGSRYDLRDTEIWYQAMWYLSGH